MKIRLEMRIQHVTMRAHGSGARSLRPLNSGDARSRSITPLSLMSGTSGRADWDARRLGSLSLGCSEMSQTSQLRSGCSNPCAPCLNRFCQIDSEVLIFVFSRNRAQSYFLEENSKSIQNRFRIDSEKGAQTCFERFLKSIQPKSDKKH